MIARARRVYDVCGIVQGVGFRPHVARLARAHALGGWVANVASGVHVETEGSEAHLAEFARALTRDVPPRARVDRVDVRDCPPIGEQAFRIRVHSSPADKVRARDDVTLVPIAADGAMCAACLEEVLDPGNRRYRYPFTSCTDCGPRYSILETLPYERANTSMRHFLPCRACRAEMESPDDRRFHAQANACTICGPRLALLDGAGQVVEQGNIALCSAAAALRDGRILALKGLGGYQLLVDASRSRVVRELRRRKARPHKPFAVLLPDLKAVRCHCTLDKIAAQALTSTAAPIVLLHRHCDPSAAGPQVDSTSFGDRRVSRAVAPGSSLLGVMLPCTPLHYLLAREAGLPLVATSGNRTGEPMAIDEKEALVRLDGIADVYLSHDRPIVRALDDSLERIVAGRVLPLRRARGYAPVSIPLPHAAPPVLALGGHLKTTLALAAGCEVLVGEHLGDLDSPLARRGWERAARHWPALLGVSPRLTAHDTHPDYHSVQFASRYTAYGTSRGAGDGDRSELASCVAVPHHVAHALACLADGGQVGDALAIVWDGSGHGGDGTIRGGEFLQLNSGRVHRIAHLAHFRLPGGERAVAEPRRAALGALLALVDEDRFVALAESGGNRSGGEFTNQAAERAAHMLLSTFSPSERRDLVRMATRGVNAPITSSAGRLFDVVAALLGVVRRSTFEGQAAAMLEYLADRDDSSSCDTHSVGCRVTPRTVLPVPRLVHRAAGSVRNTAESRLIIDWRPTLSALLNERERGASRASLARGFHDAMADVCVDVACYVGERRVALSGGCFQNARLLAGISGRLADKGFEPVWHRSVPPNDGGLALGQAIAAIHGIKVTASSRGRDT